MPPRLPPEFVRPGQCPRREGRSYTCLSNGKLERNFGECAGSGVLSHSPAERLGELAFGSQAESSNGSAQACRSDCRSAICGPTASGDVWPEAERNLWLGSLKG